MSPNVKKETCCFLLNNLLPIPFEDFDDLKDGLSMILELDRLNFRVKFEIVFKRDWTPPVATWPETKTVQIRKELFEQPMI